MTDTELLLRPVSWRIVQGAAKRIQAEFESSSEAASLTFFLIQWLRRLTRKSSFRGVPPSDKSSCVAPLVSPSLLIQPSD